MKVLRNLVLPLTLFFTITAAGCTKEKNDSLPPETQTGANTFGCLIDGKVFVPKGSDGYSGTNKTAYYQYIYPSPYGYVFIISATNYDKDPLENMVVGLDSLKISEGMRLKLSTGLPGHGGATYRIGTTTQNEYNTSDRVSGELIFTKFDEVNQIVSGTFWFDAINPQGNILHVTEGRFDVKYTR